MSDQTPNQTKKSKALTESIREWTLAGSRTRLLLYGCIMIGQERRYIC